MRHLKYQRAVLAFAATAFIITTIGLPPRAGAQLREVVIAPGFQFNLFADPTNVPEFAVDSFTGPVAMAFDRRGRMFVATASGKILILLDNDEDGRSDEVKVFATGIPIPLGIAFRSNGDLFVSSNIFGGKGRILRLRDTDGDDRADEITTIVDDLPSQGKHQTGRLRFGPDGLLYFGQGSATDKGEGSPGEGPLNAAILRVNVNTVVTPVVQVFASGLRNAFGMAFHPENGELFATDAGSGDLCVGVTCPQDPSPPEEVNWVVAGGHYGFPRCEGMPVATDLNCAGIRPPAIQYFPHLTPTALAFYTGPQAGEFKNQLLLTLYNNLPNADNHGGDLRRVVVEGDPQTGFRLRDDGFIAQFDPIDPGDGPVDVIIDPIAGDIYVIRFDPVNHPHGFPGEHHHFIYRIHRQGSGALPFIGPPSPASVKVGSGAVTINLVGRRLKPGAVAFADGVALATRQGATASELQADIPASMLSSERNITIDVQNPDGARTNQQQLAVTRDDPPPPPPPDVSPQITSFFVYKKVRTRVVNKVKAGAKPKKLSLVVVGTDFDAGAQLLINGESVQIDSRSSTEIVGRFTAAMLAAPGELTIQVRNSTNRTSNSVKLTVVSKQ